MTGEIKGDHTMYISADIETMEVYVDGQRVETVVSQAAYSV